jgi:hypothetical protein
MIGRMISQRGKVNKKRDKMNRCKQKECNSRDYQSFKVRESKNTCEVRYKPSNQKRSWERKSRMDRMKQMNRKRNPLGKEVPKSSRRVTKIEQEVKDAEGTFQTLLAPKGNETITQWENELRTSAKVNCGMHWRRKRNG